MRLAIDPRLATPISEQIAEQIRFAVADGRLAAGERLPSVRGLAKDLLVNPNTVAKVYRDLEREGVLRTKPGSGAFVADGSAEICRERSFAAVKAALRLAVEKGVAAGLEPQEIERTVAECLGPHAARVP